MSIEWDHNPPTLYNSTSYQPNTSNSKANKDHSKDHPKQINQFWNYSGFLNFKTQLLPGFRFYNQGENEMRERVSQFLSPAILQGGLGFCYKKH